MKGKKRRDIGQSASVAPEVLEARGRQLGVAHGVLDVAMAEIRLQGADVGALVGKLKAAGVSEHVRVRLEAELGRNAQPRHHLAPPGGGEGRAAASTEKRPSHHFTCVALQIAHKPRCNCVRGENVLNRTGRLGSSRVVLSQIGTSD